MDRLVTEIQVHAPDGSIQYWYVDDRDPEKVIQDIESLFGYPDEVFCNEPD